MPKLTKRVVEATEIRDKDYIIFDNDIPGYGLRVLRSGKRSYMIQYRVGRKTRRMSLGLHGIPMPPSRSISNHAPPSLARQRYQASNRANWSRRNDQRTVIRLGTWVKRRRCRAGPASIPVRRMASPGWTP